MRLHRKFCSAYPLSLAALDHARRIRFAAALEQTPYKGERGT